MMNTILVPKDAYYHLFSTCYHAMQLLKEKNPARKVRDVGGFGFQAYDNSAFIELHAAYLNEVDPLNAIEISRDYVTFMTYRADLASKRNISETCYRVCLNRRGWNAMKDDFKQAMLDSDCNLYGVTWDQFERYIEICLTLFETKMKKSFERVMREYDEYAKIFTQLPKIDFRQFIPEESKINRSTTKGK